VRLVGDGLVLAALLVGCAQGAQQQPDIVEAQTYFEGYEPLPAGSLSCPSDFEALRHRATRYVDDFCGQLIWPGGVNHRGPIRRSGIDGQLWFEGQYRDGRRAGTWTVYWPDGTVYARWDFDRGVLSCPEKLVAVQDETKSHLYCFDGSVRRPVGPFIVFNEAMRLKITGVHGVAGREGTWVRWDTSGRLISVELFRNNELVSQYLAP
jgi:hypothetical protein